ncbi:MAG: hypothetical protein AVDCRST_MAG41-334 [uncultured Corynebacteriales bacterium]|uniref:Uncharacterized protein n=1 Tax=uncultured Mycobacteriales bacterium TaxID=581187 RepID=A0A6J4H8Q1_9ACTN|nr:MAG: hypothetical protein AVDCRST_MAG41-334 [uncultured Corynebacteriales bacterium]
MPSHPSFPRRTGAAPASRRPSWREHDTSPGRRTDVDETTT